MRKPLVFFVLVFLYVNLNCFVECAKILAIFPYPSATQYFTVKPYLEELRNRSHEVFLISHQFPQQNVPNIKLNFKEFPVVVASELTKRKHEEPLLMYHVNITNLVLENPEVKQLLKNESASFDLVIVDILMPTALFAIAKHFRAHLIGVSADTTEMHIDNLVGNESPRSYLPVASSVKLPPQRLIDRAYNFKCAMEEWFFVNVCESKEQQLIYQAHFSHLNATLNEIFNSFALVLLNQHFSMGVARPYVPNMVEVGGMFISEQLEPIPTDVLRFIESAPSHVIYFSLGANIPLRSLDPQKVDALRAFVNTIEYRVLWKVDYVGDHRYLSQGVMVRDWFPQRAILAHPKVSVFVTHAGYLSIVEAIVYGKPIVGIPIFTAHLNNMRLVEHFDIGIGVNYVDVTKKDVTAAVYKVLKNDRYRDNIKKLRTRFLDRLTKPLDLAIFWTEYILRHDGAVFMRVIGRDMYWFTYNNYDIWLLLFLGVTVMLYLQTLCFLRVKFAFVCVSRSMHGYWIQRGFTAEQREQFRRARAPPTHYDAFPPMPPEHQALRARNWH